VELFSELVVFGVCLGVFEDGLVFPEVVGGLELDGVFGLLAFVAGFFDPSFEDFAVAFEFVRKFWVGGEVVDLVRVYGEVVEFFFWAGAEPVLFLVRGEGASFVGFFELDEFVAVIAVLSLEEGAVSVVVTEVAEFVGADGADAVDGVVAAVAGANDVGDGFVVFSEEVLAVEVVWECDVGEGEGGGGDVEGVDEFVTDGACCKGGVVSFDDERDVDASFVAELFVAEGLVISVIGEEEDDGVVEFAIGFELLEDGFDAGVDSSGGVVVGGPGFAECRSVGEVGWEGNLAGFKDVAFTGVFAVGFASFEFDLAEPGLGFIGAGVPGVFGDGHVGMRAVALPAVHAGFVVGVGADGVELGAVVV